MQRRDAPDENEAVHSTEAIFSRFLRPGLKLLDMSERVAYALDELELDPEAPNILDTGLEEFANLIGELSISPISIFTLTLFDFVLAEAEEAAQERWYNGTRLRGILFLARVLGDSFPASDLLGSGYARRAVEAARHAAQKERRDDKAGLVAALEEKKRLGRVAALEEKKRRGA